MFTRRGFNIDALTVGETERPEYSRITICLSGDGYAREQLINQLRKLHNVKKVDVLEDDCIKRELMLIKVKYDKDTRADILAAADVYRAKVIDYTTDEMCIEATGDPTKIDAFIKLMIPFGIIEMCRTGIVALERGNTSLFD
jgi:acetolactate synthase-1/3 small subunit